MHQFTKLQDTTLHQTTSLDLTPGYEIPDDDYDVNENYDKAEWWWHDMIKKT